MSPFRAPFDPFKATTTMPSTVLAFRSRKQQEAAKKKGDIRGFFGKLPRGRPPASSFSFSSLSLPMNANVSKLNETAKAMKKKAEDPVYLNYKRPELFEQLRLAVQANISKEKQESTDDVATKYLISRSSLQRHTKTFNALMEEHQIPIQAITREQVFPLPRGTGNSLLSDEDISLLASAIVHRDETNKPMSRKEAITLVQQLSQCHEPKTAENHYDYLVRTKRLVGVKNDGKTVKAQTTTDKRSQINVEQQLRWHTTVEEALQEQQRLNQPFASFEMLQDHFFANLDETCLMANGDGSIRVLGSAAKKKTEKISDDSRASVTSIRVGNAAGMQGPFVFLAKGIKFDRPPIKRILKDRCPAESVVVMTPNAYLTDEAFDQLVPSLCKGIRAMPVVKDHPDWWLVLSMDGFGSHVNVNTAHEVFFQHKIFVIKEEGDTSHVNQAYDQFVAKQVSLSCFVGCFLLSF